MPIFSTAYSKLTKKKFSSTTSETARTALEDQFGFTIVPDVPVKIISKPDGTVFFTLLIEREVKEELKFENLMIQIKNNETSAAIFKYTMEEKAIKTITNEIIIKEIPNSQFTDLNIDGKMFFNSDGDTCFDINVIQCSVPDHRPAGHIATSECWSYFNNVAGASNIYYATSVVCMNDGGIGGGGETGGTGGTSSSTNNTGGLGASGGSSDPVVISPTPCHTANCIESTLDPCDKIKKMLLSNPTLSTKLQSLAGMTSQTVEKGKYNTSITNTINDLPSSASGEIVIPPLPSGEMYLLIAHTHNSPSSSTYSIYSWEDLENMSKLIKSGQIDINEFILIVITADGTRYALTVSDTNSYLKFFAFAKDPLFEMDIAMNRVKVMDKYYFDKTKPLIKENSTNNVKDEKSFLKMLDENNMGLTLFEINSTFTTFSKVKLNKTTNTITPTPCNN